MSTMNDESLIDTVLAIIDNERSRYKVAVAVTAFIQSRDQQIALEARIDEHNLVFTKSGELSDSFFAEWSFERLKELGVEDEAF